MKICQICRTSYSDDQVFCFEDGSLLVDSDKEKSEATLNIPIEKLPGFNAARTANQNSNTNPVGNYKARSRNPLFMVLGIFATGVIIASAIVVGILYFVMPGLRSLDPKNESPTPISKPTIGQTPKREAQLRVEIKNSIKGSFGSTHLRCLVTNIGDGIVEVPRISLVLKRDDVKVGSRTGNSKFPLIKPNQTIPIWVDVSNIDFTNAELENNPSGKISDKGEDILFPKVQFLDVKYTNKTLTSLYNNRPYAEVFYRTTGIVQNSDYDKLRLEIFVFYYDESKQIVGISSSGPPEIKRGEKAEFEVQEGETNFFGKPVEYEIFAIAK